jgi:hypothetical protein
MLTDPSNREANLRAQRAAWRTLELAEPPTERRSRELWMQHAAGLLLFERVRAAGLASIDPGAAEETRAAATLAVDSAMYALMMLIDGASGGLKGQGRAVDLTFGVELVEGHRVVTKLDLRAGDGMCMGYHSWTAGDFGEDPVLATPPKP